MELSHTPNKLAPSEEGLNFAPDTQQTNKAPNKIRKNANVSRDGSGWYVVYTIGHEDKIKQQILKRAENMGVKDDILDIHIPKKTVTKIKSGKRVDKNVPRYQRYIFVQMLMTETTFRVVRHTPGVLDIIDRPLSQQEVARLFGRVRRTTKLDPDSSSSQELESQFSVDFVIGDEIKVEGGAFDGFTGKASSIDLEHGKVTVMVSVFGRFTPVELTLDQVRPLDGL